MIRFIVFEPLKTAFNEHQKKMENLLEGYRKTLDRYRAIYNEDTFQAYKNELITSTRDKILAADQSFSNAVGIATARLRRELADQIKRPVDEKFVNIMRTVKDFGIKLSRTEIETLARQAAGNLTELRVIASVAAASGYEVQYTTPDELSRDIERLENMARLPLLTVPMDLSQKQMTVFRMLSFATLMAASHNLPGALR